MHFLFINLKDDFNKKEQISADMAQWFKSSWPIPFITDIQACANPLIAVIKNMNLTHNVVHGRNGTTFLAFQTGPLQKTNYNIKRYREAALSPNCSNHACITANLSTNFIAYLLPLHWILLCIAMIRINVCPVFFVLTQMEDPAIHWQIALYRNLPYHFDNSNPEKIVARVLHIANVLFHLDQVYECGCVFYI